MAYTTQEFGCCLWVLYSKVGDSTTWGPTGDRKNNQIRKQGMGDCDSNLGPKKERAGGEMTG